MRRRCAHGAASRGCVCFPSTRAISLGCSVQQHFWNMFFCCVQMVEALGGRGSEPALCVLLFTSANTVGRMVAGSVTERLLHRYGVPRCAYGAARPAGMQRHTQLCSCPRIEQAPKTWRSIPRLACSTSRWLSRRAWLKMQ